MIDHVGYSVSDFKKSKNFYTKALKPLGYEILVEVSEETPKPTSVETQTTAVRSVMRGCKVKDAGFLRNFHITPSPPKRDGHRRDHQELARIRRFRIFVLQKAPPFAWEHNLVQQ